MKLKNIKIEKLFGLEQNNFDIDLYPDENVTLLYGFNGVGKTSIIKLVDAVLCYKITDLCYIQFSTIILTFDNDSVIKVTKSQEMIKIIGKKKQQVRPITACFNINDLQQDFTDNITDSNLKKLKNHFFLMDSNIIFANKDFNRVINSPVSLWENFDKTEQNRKKIYCSKLEARSIINYLKQQFEKDKKTEKIHFFVEIPDKLEELNKVLYKDKRKSLSNEKITLFENIINKRFGLLYKNVRLTDKELLLENVYSEDECVELNCLSSGEKNIICLFLELIFFSKDNSVFFIDEPEASLHVEWQCHLVDCILEISKKYNIQVIIATHAPEVVGEYDGITNEIQSERFRFGTKYFEK